MSALRFSDADRLSVCGDGFPHKCNRSIREPFSFARIFVVLRALSPSANFRSTRVQSGGTMSTPPVYKTLWLSVCLKKILVPFFFNCSVLFPINSSRSSLFNCMFVNLFCFALLAYNLVPRAFYRPFCRGVALSILGRKQYFCSFI